MELTNSNSNTTTNHHPTNSPSSSTSSVSSAAIPNTTTTTDPMQSWWESVSKARSHILSLSSLLPSTSSFSLSSLADSDRPALSFLSSLDAYLLLSYSLCGSGSGSGSDPLCQWLYETYLSADPNLRLIVISFVPLVSGLYLSRIHSSDSTTLPSLAGFEAVLLAIYSNEVKSRAGKPVLVQIPDLSQPSLYHSPRKRDGNDGKLRSGVGVLCPPLEAQVAVKSTKRPIIVGVAFDCYFKVISQMPSWSKVELCRYVANWAGQDCVCKDKFDRNAGESEKLDGYFLEGKRSLSNGSELEIVESVGDEIGKLRIGEKEENGSCSEREKGVRIPLPWEMLQPLLRILGHCLLGPLNSQDVKDAASVSVRRLYARASHDLNSQAILATRSLIQLDIRAKEAAKAAAVAANSSSNVNTPSKAKKPEILLVSK